LTRGAGWRRAPPAPDNPLPAGASGLFHATMRHPPAQELDRSRMELIKGIPVSPGIVIGRVFVLDDEHHRIPKRSVAVAAVPKELARLDAALTTSVAELQRVREQAERQMGVEAAKIFWFHIGMLSDKSLVDPMRTMVQTQRTTAEYAVYKTLSDWAERFAHMDDSAFTTKVNDIKDLAARVLKHLLGEHHSKLNLLDHQAVIVAADLTPSQAAGFDRSRVIAFATDLGGRTSHTAIVARALDIPAVVGCKDLAPIAQDGMPVIVDGDRGVVILDPTPAQVDEYKGFIEQRRLFELSLDEVAGLPSITRDEIPVEILGNIEFPEEVEGVLSHGGAGVGLYRTEFLYLTRKMEPTEEDHFNAYQRCMTLLQAGLPPGSPARPLVIRTVDLGADKYTQEQFDTPERNPFLGCRSIRYCLKNLPMFRRQLRALLRASGLGPIKIMFPLITSTNELRQARHVLHDAMEDLDEEGIPFDRKIPVGIMVEVPSAAIMADTFAREVDFFSIGTNDLVQYTLAVDRTNERVAGLYNPAHPAVLRLIRDVTRAARRHKVPVSCCGESAGDLEFALLLMGLGLRTLSVTASSIPRVKRLVRSVSIAQCERIARRAISFDSDVEVAAYVRDETRKIIPEAFDGRAAEERA
jgi:phosphotransferase system enzyme I (PtsI)